ncbi:MAG: membrane protein insertase YidC [Bradymonadales bacterium]|nr:MAG: membrane protein insertase YidC [Bradymonadales bacterium]
MDFRTLIGICLMIIVYFVFVVPPATQDRPSPEPDESSSSREQAELSAPTERKAPQPDRVVRPEISELRRKNFVFSTDRLRLGLNALGEIQSIEVLNYAVEPQSEEQVAWDFRDRAFNETRLFINDRQVVFSLKEASENQIRLEARSSDFVIERLIELQPNAYALAVTDRVKNTALTRAIVDLQILLRKEIEDEKKVEGIQRFFAFLVPPADYQQAVWLQNSNLKKDFLSSLAIHKEPDPITELVGWSGFSTKYFFLGFIPLNASIEELRISRRSEDWASQELRLFQRQLLPDETTEYRYTYYLGPKRMQELEKVGFELGKVIDFGRWIGPISRLLLTMLTIFHSWIPNYGIAIILLTVFVKCLLFPLTYKSAVSMRKLSIVQPKMKEIRDKFKNDQKRMQTEMMALYRKEKVNPIGGCLPILLQFPIFFALYRVFYESFEMRHAEFFWWIQDLSARDPWFVIPVLMTFLMYFQQKLMPMPTTGEDNEMVRIQKAMFKWMPIMFGVFMLFFPSGLTLYFLSNAAISIAQQYFVNKRLDVIMPRPEIKPAKPKS